MNGLVGGAPLVGAGLPHVGPLNPALYSSWRWPQSARSFHVRGSGVLSVVSAEHLVDVLERPAPGLGQRGAGEQRPDEVDAGEEREGGAAAEPDGERPVQVGAGGAGREPDEAAGGRGDAAHRLREQLGVEDARHARPAERVDGHEDRDTDERRHPAAASGVVAFVSGGT